MPIKISGSGKPFGNRFKTIVQEARHVLVLALLYFRRDFGEDKKI